MAIWVTDVKQNLVSPKFSLLSCFQVCILISKSSLTSARKCSSNMLPHLESMPMPFTTVIKFPETKFQGTVRAWISTIQKQVTVTVLH